MITDATSFGELLDRRAELTPDAVMLADTHGDVVTFEEFRARVLERAAGLDSFGVDRTARVCWQLPSTIEALVVFTALSMLGALQIPLLMAYRQRELSRLFATLSPELILTTMTWKGADHASLVREAMASAGVDAPIVDATALAADGWDRRDRGRPVDVRYLYATSGSTGAPKLVCHSDQSLLSWVAGQSSAQGVDESDVTAFVIPVAHVGGALVLGQSLMFGNTSLVVDGFDPDRTPQFMSDRGTTIISTVPVVYGELVAAQRRRPERRLFPSLRYCASGAAPKPPGLDHDVRTVLGGRGLLTGYGMSEAGAIAVPRVDDTDEQLESTVGRVLPGLSVRIVGPTEEEVPPGDIGEIRVKGPSIFSGYLDAALDEAFDEDGYFRSGDLGRIRPGDSHLQITGRLKDIIIRKGENISPQEVEDVLYRMPGVKDVVVYGVPDVDLGERVCAAVVPEPDRPPITVADVFDFCIEAGMMTQKIPQRVDLYADLPRTPTGKADKVRLRSLAAPTIGP